MKVRWEKYLFSPCGWIFKALEGNGLLWLSNYLLALSLTGIMLSFDVRGFVSRNVSVGHALRNFRIFTGCQAGKTGPERLIHLGCASCRVDSIPPLCFWERTVADNIFLRHCPYLTPFRLPARSRPGWADEAAGD